MRCRKARSLTSAYSNDELAGRKLTALRAHLASCVDCRQEAALMRSIRLASPSLPSIPLSEDFNQKLLNRIAHERFAETRTKAFLPGRIPLGIWPKLASVTAVAAALALVFGIYGTNGLVPAKNVIAGSSNSSTSGQDDSYLTALPLNNPNVAAHLNQNWSLGQQLARSERITRISNNLTARSGFGDMRLAGTYSRSRYFPQVTAPYSITYIRIKPLVLEFHFVPNRSAGGSQGEY